MPAHNTAAFIGAALESVIAQTHTRLEVVVVDDGSTDETAAVAERYARRDSRIRLIRGDFGGPSGARNCAFDAARGELFALLDSDDMWTPTFLERQLDLLAGHPGTMLVSGNAVNFGGAFDGLPLDRARGVRMLGFGDVLGDETAVCIMTVFRREVIEAVGPFDVSQRRSEDYDLWLRATHGGFLILKNTEPLGYYRRRTESLSAAEERMLTGILQVYEKVSAWPLRPEEREILTRQTARLERRRLVLHAKAALAARDFAEAQRLFEAAARDGGWKAAVAAFAIRRWPESFFRAVSRRGDALMPAAAERVPAELTRLD